MANDKRVDRTPEQQYLSDLRSAPAQHPIHQLLDGPRHGQQRVYFHDFWLSSSPPHPTTLEEVRSWEPAFDDAQTTAVCVIESICSSWIACLGAAWKLEHDFFLDYANIQAKKGAWYDSELAGDSNLRRHNHVDGVLQHLAEEKTQPNRSLRRFQHEQRYGWQALSRISYYRVWKHLYLFLVDAPFVPDMDDTRWLPPSKLSLWAPHSRSTRGLPIPQLYSMASFSPFELLQDFLRQHDSFFVLFESKHDRSDPNNLHAVLPGVFAQYLAALAWKTNIEHIDRELKYIAFRELRRPNLAINNRLHDLREDLNTLREQVTLANAFLQRDDELPHAYDSSTRTVMNMPADELPEILARVPLIERFLMDTFQLCMSSISVLDSQSGIQSAKRSATLTQLATVYVPLSFITGIWGMNIREINDSPHPLWMFGVTLVLAVAITVAGLLLLRYWEDVVAFFRFGRRRHESKIGVDLERPKRTCSKLA